MLHRLTIGNSRVAWCINNRLNRFYLWYAWFEPRNGKTLAQRYPFGTIALGLMPSERKGEAYA
jgi:hypothetical protein